MLNAIDNNTILRNDINLSAKISQSSPQDLTWLLNIANASLTSLGSSANNYPIIRNYYQSAHNALNKGDIPSARWFTMKTFECVFSEVLDQVALSSIKTFCSEPVVGKIINYFA